jgi:hypothetical protein
MILRVSTYFRKYFRNLLPLHVQYRHKKVSYVDYVQYTMLSGLGQLYTKRQQLSPPYIRTEVRKYLRRYCTLYTDTKQRVAKYLLQSTVILQRLQIYMKCTL